MLKKNEKRELILYEYYRDIWRYIEKPLLQFGNRATQRKLYQIIFNHPCGSNFPSSCVQSPPPPNTNKITCFCVYMVLPALVKKVSHIVIAHHVITHHQSQSVDTSNIKLLIIRIGVGMSQNYKPSRRLVSYQIKNFQIICTSE